MSTPKTMSLSRSDVWVAHLAGEGAWGTGERPEAAARLAAQVQVTGLVVVLSVMWTLVPERLASSARPWIPTTAAMITSATLLGVLVSPLVLAFGRRRPLRRPVTAALVRLGASTCLYLGIVIVLPGWRALAAWPLGVAGGADAILTRWALGLPFDGRRWWANLVRSPVMAGVVTGLVIVLIADGPGGRTTAALMLFLALTLALTAAWGTMWLLDANRQRLDERVEDAVRRARNEEHRRRAHWLHDDVCAELQLTSLRLRTGKLAPAHVASELAELDHRLRVRQTDELIASGDARLAELVQPALRRLQAAGVRLLDVPSLDDANLHLRAHEARLFTRMVGALVSNAVNAGAGAVSLLLHHDHQVISVTVIDDAGGFPDQPLPPGRGLERLVNELGPGSITVEPTALGSRVTLRMPYGRDRSAPAYPAEVG